MDKLSKLEQLNELRSKGIVSENEFITLKDEIIHSKPLKETFDTSKEDIVALSEAGQNILNIFYTLIVLIVAPLTVFFLLFFKIFSFDNLTLGLGILQLLFGIIALFNLFLAGRNLKYSYSGKSAHGRTSNTKAFRKSIIIIVTVISCLITFTKEWQENNNPILNIGNTENYGRAGTNSAVSGLGCLGGAAIGARLGSSIGPVGMGVGALVGGLLGTLSTNPVGESVSDSIWGHEGAQAGSSVGGTQYDSSKIR